MIFLMAQLLSVSMAFAGNDRDEESSFPFVFLLLVVLILIGVVAFFGWRILRDLRQKLEDMDAKVQKYKVQLSEELKALPKEVRNHLDTNKVQTKSQSEMQEQKEEDKLSKEVLDSVDPQPEKIVQIRYLSLPKDGVFDLGCEVYRTGKVLFVLTAQDDKGTFGFCSKSDSINYVRRGRDVLDLACVVQNGRVASFSNIVTDVPGTVIRIENGWKIKEKAKVHFEN